MQTAAFKMKKCLNCQSVSWGLMAIAWDTTENWTYIMFILRPSLTAIWAAPCEVIIYLISFTTNNPEYKIRMSAQTVSVQSWNSHKYRSIKGYCNMLLTVPDPKHKLCYLQSYKEWTHTTNLSIITQTTAVHDCVPHPSEMFLSYGENLH